MLNQPLNTNSFRKVDNELIDNNTLVLIDIDDTIIRSLCYWGSGKHFGTMGNEKIQMGYTQPQAKVNIYPRWIQSQSAIKTKLVDEYFPIFLENAKRNSLLTIAYTARRPSIAEATIKQLKQHKVFFDTNENFNKFSFSKTYRNSLQPDISVPQALNRLHECDAEYLKGILYCHELNNKGTVFLDFYHDLTQYCLENKITVPTHVLFFDDGLHNVNALKNACQKLGLKYTGVHFEVEDYHYDKSVAQVDEKLHSITGRELSRSYSFNTFTKNRRALTTPTPLARTRSSSDLFLQFKNTENATSEGATPKPLEVKIKLK